MSELDSKDTIAVNTKDRRYTVGCAFAGVAVPRHTDIFANA